MAVSVIDAAFFMSPKVHPRPHITSTLPVGMQRKRGRGLMQRKGPANLRWPASLLLNNNLPMYF
jgi:hypothetical protein